MRLFQGGLAARPAVLLALLLLVLMVARVSAQNTDATTDATNAATTEAAATTGTATETAATDATTTAADATTTDSLPGLTTSSASASASATSDSGLPSLPTLSSDPSNTYNYPPPSVPPTANAPYMQKSNVPEGTVFIAVGGALGLIGLAVLAWRGLVAWSVNRSVRRAAMMHSRPEAKTLLRQKRKSTKSAMYTQTPGSTMSLEKLGASNRASYMPPNPKIPSSASGLFYSPTAGAGVHGNANRASNYLPAGYYAAGNSTPGGGSGMSHPQSGSIGLPTLGPQSQGYSRTRSVPSPPASPILPPSRGHDGSYRMSQAGASTTSLNAPPQGRAPSAYLEDLFESHTPGPDQGHR